MINVQSPRDRLGRLPCLWSSLDWTLARVFTLVLVGLLVVLPDGGRAQQNLTDAQVAIVVRRLAEGAQARCVLICLPSFLSWLLYAECIALHCRRCRLSSGSTTLRAKWEVCYSLEAVREAHASPENVGRIYALTRPLSRHRHSPAPEMHGLIFSCIHLHRLLLRIR